MKRLHRMILRALPGPFLGWLTTLMFLLLMQFLIKYLPDIAGKGLPLPVIAELIVYNLAYMAVLAVPMSALLATLMVFGALAESQAYAVMKNAGISLMQLLWPVLVAGLLLTAAMTYFNNNMLPEANFRAKNLWQDIRTKKPGFELRPGVFYNGISDYSILVKDLPADSNELIDVTIYDYTEGSQRQAIIKAKRGRLTTVGDGEALDLELEEGEVHRLKHHPGPGIQERYERLAFGRYHLRLDLSDFAFERSDPREGYRSDRTTSTSEMRQFVDSLDADVEKARSEMHRLSLTLAADTSWHVASQDPPPLPAPDTGGVPPTGRIALAGLDIPARQEVYDAALEEARQTRSRMEALRTTLTYDARRADRYRVEIYKKYSIALACFIFMLIGAPLGLSIRRGGLGTVGALALGIFMFYWITLVQGEKLADRDMLTPWVGMWIANIVMAFVGLYLIAYVTMDLRATSPLWRRLLESCAPGRHLPSRKQDTVLGNPRSSTGPRT